MPDQTKQTPVTALSGADWADELNALRNAFGAYEEFGDFDGQRATFDHVLDVAYRFMAQQKLDAPVRPPWAASEYVPRPGHYRGWEDDQS